MSLGNDPIFIIGYMGAGKTTIGRLLADALGFQFIDTDTFIENRFKKHISQIFADEGEAVFRRREKVVLEELSGMNRVVISTGGGTPCYADNMDLMNAMGITIYIDVEEDDLITRLQQVKRTRPLISQKSKDEIAQYVIESMAIRRPIYERAQLIAPSVYGKHKETALLIAEQLQNAATEMKDI